MSTFSLVKPRFYYFGVVTGKAGLEVRYDEVLRLEGE